MGMLVGGTWQEDEDRFMREGAFCREETELPQMSAEALAARLAHRPEPVLVASMSCPWSHRTLLVRGVKGLDRIPVVIAGGPRIEGYGLIRPAALIAGAGPVKFVHQLYTATAPDHTGRATVPLIWDKGAGAILSNSSATIARALDGLTGARDIVLAPAPLRDAIDALNTRIYDGLSNAVYRAGLAEVQAAYDVAVSDVYRTLDWLEARLEGRRFLLGERLTEADLFLFATLVRFDIVYATLFRCTRRRLVEYPRLWAYARDVHALPGVAKTVDFEAIRAGYFLNDTSNNPHGILPDLPEVDWTPDAAGAG